MKSGVTPWMIKNHNGVTQRLNLMLSYQMNGVIWPKISSSLLITVTAFIIALGVVISVGVLSIICANNWESFILIFHRIPFGLADPQFGLDATFYIVTLKALNFVQGWLLGLVTICITISLVVYLAVFSIRKVNLFITPKMLNHIVATTAFLMIVIALNHLLDIYELIISENGIIFGATYTDIQVRLPLYIFLSALASITASAAPSRYSRIARIASSLPGIR